MNSAGQWKVVLFFLLLQDTFIQTKMREDNDQIKL